MNQDTAIAIGATVIPALVAVALTLGLVLGAGSRSMVPQDCAEWTDGCIVCTRTPEGLACSTPGIACVRGPGRCLRQGG